MEIQKYFRRYLPSVNIFFHTYVNFKPMDNVFKLNHLLDLTENKKD